jgi:hypothetical protein
VNPYWSYLLTAVGVFGLYLAGRKDRRGWMVGIGAQVLWIAYATATHQWGFYVSALAYGFINWRNLRAWKPTPKPTSTERVKAMLGLTRAMSHGRPMLDPIGWDEAAQRVHDVEPGPHGLLHHSGCWCRVPDATRPYVFDLVDSVMNSQPLDFHGHVVPVDVQAALTPQDGSWHPVCRYCGADCSEGRSWDGGDLYACPRCAERRAAAHRAGRLGRGVHLATGCTIPDCVHPSHGRVKSTDIPAGRDRFT